MPWGRVDDTYYDHPKLERLTEEHDWPDRLAAAGLNALAWSWCNRFLTDGHVPTNAVTRLGGTPDLAELLVGIGLWEEAANGFQIHDFLMYNDSREQVLERRAKEAKRKADWRMSHRDKKEPIGPPEAGPSGTSNGSGPNVTPPVPSSVPPGQRRVSRAESRDSHARAIARIPTRPDPTRPNESLKRESRAGERADIAALHQRGWKRVSPKQRAVLDEVLGRHDVTGPAFAAEVIRMTPADGDPLAAVMAADKAWQDAERRRANVEAEAWAKEKDDERAAAERLKAEPPEWLQPAESRR